MTVGTLQRYLLWRFAAMVLAVLIAILLIIFLIDMIETVRRYSGRETFSWPMVIQFAAMRSLFGQDKVLPFVFLVGSVLGLVELSRRSELIVARANGVSVWGILAMPIAFALVFGVFSVLVLTPLNLSLKHAADRIENELRGNATAAADDGVWLRQSGSDGPSIMHADTADADALVLNGAMAFLFADQDLGFRQKIVAKTAQYVDRTWVMRDAVVTSGDAERARYETYILPTNLSAAEAHRLITQPDTLSVRALPAFIRTAARSGLKTAQFRFAFHEFLARPFFLSAMVLIAATVSLRPARAGGMGRLILAGITGGFLLYISGEILRDLGGNAIVDPRVAAWAPSIVALVIGTTVLLFQEDG